MKKNITTKETDMYLPIKQLLELHGFTVKGEVKNCDIVAIRATEPDDNFILNDQRYDIWIVEMKRHLSVNLLAQALSRLSITNCVFVAIPRPKRIDKNFRSAQKILKKLELGLIIVALDSSTPFAEIALLPGKMSTKRNKKTALIFREIIGRTGDNPGGSTKIKITTAYKERCIKIACILNNLNPIPDTRCISPKDLIMLYDCDKDAGLILQKNHYGWFCRVSRGLYTISDAGRDFLEKNKDNPVVTEYQKFVILKQS